MDCNVTRLGTRMPLPNNAAATDSAAEALRRAMQFSRYARRALERDPGLLPSARIATPLTADEMRATLSATAFADEPSLWCALRKLREQVMLRVIARDLSGWAGLEEVVATMTAL